MKAHDATIQAPVPSPQRSTSVGGHRQRQPHQPARTAVAVGAQPEAGTSLTESEREMRTYCAKSARPEQGSAGDHTQAGVSSTVVVARPLYSVRRPTQAGECAVPSPVREHSSPPPTPPASGGVDDVGYEAGASSTEVVGHPPSVRRKAQAGERANVVLAAACDPPLPHSSVPDADDDMEGGSTECGSGTRVFPAIGVHALRALLSSERRPTVLTVGDRRGRARDAVNGGGEVAISVDILPSESDKPGYHFQGDVRDVPSATRWSKVISFMPCEQQTISLGGSTAVIKALDGRMFWGIAQWLYVWCFNAACVVAEQPDVYIRDFYDAPCMETDMADWGSPAKKRTLLFVRGAALPTPTTPGAVGSTEWHQAGAPTLAQRARMRDETPWDMARAVAEQIHPDGTQKPLRYDVELERFALAWWKAGLPLPHDYHASDAQPQTVADREYATRRGTGDGRRIWPGAVPLSVRARVRAQSQRATVGAPLTNHRTWRRLDAVEAVTDQQSPAVSHRGVALARAALQRVCAESTQQCPQLAGRTVDLSQQTRPMLALLPAVMVGGELTFLLPAEGQHTLLGQATDTAEGATSTERKRITKDAERLLAVMQAGAESFERLDARVAPVGYIGRGDSALAVLAAWVPKRRLGLPEVPGCVWMRAVHIRSVHRKKVCDVVAWRAHGWQKPSNMAQLAELRVGDGQALPTVADDRAAHEALDLQRQQELLDQGREELRELIQAAAQREPRIEDMLGCWVQKLDDTDAMLPPHQLRQAALQPRVEDFITLPFVHRCSIPTSRPMEQRWPPPRWPPGVPKPLDALSTFLPCHQSDIKAQLQKIASWNADRVAGGAAPRPAARSWSDQARLPWLQGRVLDFRTGGCRLLGAGGPAISQLHIPGWLWAFRHYKHRRLLSYIVHGVRMSDSLELDTTIAPNLFKLYDVECGAHAVADEMAQLKRRGWYASTLPEESPKNATCEPVMLTSPFRISPRGAVPRKDGGPPRGVAEDGYPRKLELTCDNGQQVDSLNNSSGDRVGLGGPRRDVFPSDEVKPRAKDACVNLGIIWALAHTLGVAVFVLLFDYKYFFHQLVYEMAEIWKRGFAVPAKLAGGGAHPRALDVLAELVMAMGWTRASLIAQDLGNALVWRLLHDVDIELETYVNRQRELHPNFDGAWKTRTALPEDDYGTQARLVSALQYTDDKLALMAGPHAACAFLVVLCRMLGPAMYVHPTAAEAARGTARRHAALLAGESVVRKRLRAQAGERVRIERHGIGSKRASHVMWTSKGAALGNPFCAKESGDDTATAYACLLACGEHNVAIEQVAGLRNLHVLGDQAKVTKREMWAALAAAMSTMRRGEQVTLVCRCRQQLGGARCHCEVLREHLLDAHEHEADLIKGPPEDPVDMEPVEAYGLGLEAAKPHKWHLGGAGVWIGVGISATWLVTWVPQHKAASLMQTAVTVLEGVCPVGEYRSFFGALQDVQQAMGGGMHLLRGMADPLKPDAELGQGPNVFVKPRRQLWARLKAWLSLLANKPGASILALRAPRPLPAEAIVWELAGDAASESHRREGLGGFFYGLWWHVPLRAIPGVEELHITCLELLEIGLGVVLLSSLLQAARRVRIISDALVAVRAIAARTSAGESTRALRSRMMAAVYAIIIATPEWRALHEPVRRAEVQQHYGECLILQDAASRGHTHIIHDVCAAIAVKPRQLHPLPARVHEYLREAVAAARAAVRDDPQLDRGPHPFGVEAIQFMVLGLWRELREGAHGRQIRALRLPEREAVVVANSVSEDVAERARDSLKFEVNGHARCRRMAEPAGSPTGVRVLHSCKARESAAERRLLRVAARALRTSEAGQGGNLDTTTPGAVALARITVIGRCARSTEASSQEGVAAALQEAQVARLATAVAPDGEEDLKDIRAMLVERSMRAIACNEDGLAVTGGQDDLLRKLLMAAQEAFQKRFAPSTSKLDKSYWRLWCQWTATIGTPPLRTNEAANTGVIPHLHEREVAIALGGFMSFVAGNPDYKVGSMLARLRGVARRHKAVGLKFVSLSLVVQAAEGLVREHVDVHGADSLQPRSKEPFDFAEILAMLRLPVGTRVGPFVVGDNLGWQGVVVLINVFCTTGCRKEAVAVGDGEVFGPRKWSLWHFTYRIGNVIVRAPNIRQLTALTWGDMGYLTPCPCKNDPDGRKYGNSPIPSTYHPTKPICLVREVAKYECMRLVGAADRRAAPLVLGPAERSWTKRALDDFFKKLVRMVVSEERAKQLSLHSFRVWLACALLAAGASPEQILLLLRWSSEAARKLYARMGAQSQTSLLDAACEVPLDTIRSHTLLAQAAAGAAVPLTEAEASAARALERAQELLGRAQHVAGPLPTLRSAGVVIDDDDDIRRVRESAEDLRALAARADKSLSLVEGGEDDSEPEGE